MAAGGRHMLHFANGFRVLTVLFFPVVAHLPAVRISCAACTGSSNWHTGSFDTPRREHISCCHSERNYATPGRAGSSQYPASAANDVGRVSDHERDMGSDQAVVQRSKHAGHSKGTAEFEIARIFCTEFVTDAHTAKCQAPL